MVSDILPAGASESISPSFFKGGLAVPGVAEMDCVPFDEESKPL